MAEESTDDADHGADPATGADAARRTPPGAAADDAAVGETDAADDPDGSAGTAAARDADVGPDGTARPDDIAELEERIATLRDELDAFREDVDRRTLHRDEVRADLERYVRRRIRRGHARGWGPYLVLLYGTVMTLGAFYLLEGVWAILAMIVLFLSTLGLYALFVLVGVGLNLLGVPGKAYERVREFRE